MWLYSLFTLYIFRRTKEDSSNAIKMVWFENENCEAGKTVNKLWREGSWTDSDMIAVTKNRHPRVLEYQNYICQILWESYEKFETWENQNFTTV